MVPPLAAACLCLITLTHSSVSNAPAAAADTPADSAAPSARHGKQAAAKLRLAPDTYNTQTGQHGRCFAVEGGFACGSIEQPSVNQAAPRRRFLERLWDFATGQHLKCSGPWYTSTGRLLRVAAAASVTALQVNVAKLSTALLGQSDG
jgi:hypothetical protein